MSKPKKIGHRSFANGFPSIVDAGVLFNVNAIKVEANRIAANACFVIYYRMGNKVCQRDDTGRVNALNGLAPKGAWTVQ
jgi:hypothetical protein